MQNTQVRPVRDLRNRYAEVEEYLHIKYLKNKLEEAEMEAQKPDVKWTDYRKVMKKLRGKYNGL